MEATTASYGTDLAFGAAMPELDKPPVTTRKRGRILRWILIVFLLFAVYRVGAVYVVRPHACAPPPISSRSLVTDVRDGRAAEYPRRERSVELRVMSYNIQGHATLLHPHHLDRVAEVIRRGASDIVALQEVHDGTLQSRFEDQLEHLAGLTGMRPAFGKSFSSYGGSYGNAILSRGEILGSRVYRLPGRGEPRSLFEATVLINGAPVNVYVTHLASWGRFQRGSRAAQIGCVLEIVRRSPHPFVLLGDFNTTPGSPEIRPLTESAIVRQSIDPSAATHILTQQHIDYIFPDAGWDTVSGEVIRSGPSDHWPLVATLRTRTEMEQE